MGSKKIPPGSDGLFKRTQDDGLVDPPLDKVAVSGGLNEPTQTS